MDSSGLTVSTMVVFKSSFSAIQKQMKATLNPIPIFIYSDSHILVDGSHQMASAPEPPGRIQPRQNPVFSYGIHFSLCPPKL